MTEKQNQDTMKWLAALASDRRSNKIQIHSRVAPTDSKNNRKKSRKAVDYEDGDLRGMLEQAVTDNIDPYDLLLKSGVIKDSAEFLDLKRKPK
jgi:hypothetical protein